MAFTVLNPKGSWFGLPDLGITEIFGGKTKSIGGTGEGGYGGLYEEYNLANEQDINRIVNPTYTQSNYNMPSSNVLPNTVKTNTYVPKATPGVQPPSDEDTVVKTYDKSAAAEALGVSTQELERMAKEAGFDTTEEFIRNYNPEIENIYREAENYLNQQRGRLLAGEQDYYKTFTSPYESQVPLIQQAKEQGVSNLQGQAEVAKRQEQDLLSSARRLYNEFLSRNQQAFGGSALSSIGQAASEIAAREAQRQFGNIRNTTAQTVQGILSKINEVEAQAQAQLMSLEKEKEAALSQAKLAFQDKLAAIDRDKTTLAQQKAQLKYEALLETRSRIQAIQDRTTEFAMQVELMREQARLRAGEYLQNVLGASNFYQNQAQEGTNAARALGLGNIATMGNVNAITGVDTSALSNYLLPTGYIGDYSKKLREQAGGGGS